MCFVEYREANEVFLTEKLATVLNKLPFVYTYITDFLYLNMLSRHCWSFERFEVLTVAPNFLFVNAKK